MSGTLDDGTLTEATRFDGFVTDGTLLDGMLLDGIVTDGTLLDGIVTVGVGAGVGAGVGTAAGAGTTIEIHAGSEACSASSQLPRTSPGTPLSSGVPASRAVAIVGTATARVARPAMIQMTCRFMGSSSFVGVVSMKPVRAGTSPVDDGATTRR
jgi:hypothetical protein